MAPDGSGGLETHEAQSSSVLRTKELFVEGNNVDHVTGFPFEALGMREKLIEIFRDAITDHKVLAFVDGDIDGLKVINDEWKHIETNGVIKKLVTDRETHLSEITEAEAVYVYRPQAGGDEFRAIIVCSKDTPVEILKAQLTETLVKPITATVSKKEKKEGQEEIVIKKDITVSSSSGVIVHQFNGPEDPKLVFQATQEQAENLMAAEKANKIIREIEDTIKQGSLLSLDDYIKEIQERWGNRRTSPEALGIFLYHVAAKATQRALSKKI